MLSSSIKTIFNETKTNQLILSVRKYQTGGPANVFAHPLLFSHHQNKCNPCTRSTYPPSITRALHGRYRFLIRRGLFCVIPPRPAPRNCQLARPGQGPGRHYLHVNLDKNPFICQSGNPPPVKRKKERCHELC